MAIPYVGIIYDKERTTISTILYKKMKMHKNSQNKDLKRVGWSRSPFIIFTLILGLTLGSCGAIHHLPKEEVVITYKDSTILNIKDSIRITEATRYKDMAWLGDSLKIEGQRSRMWAYADTTKEAIIGGLEEDKIEEKTRIVYKDKIVVRDSIQRVEVPVPVEVIKEVKFVPWYHKLLSAIGLISILFLGLKFYLRFRNAGRL